MNLCCNTDYIIYFENVEYRCILSPFNATFVRPVRGSLLYSTVVNGIASLLYYKPPFTNTLTRHIQTYYSLHFNKNNNTTNSFDNFMNGRLQLRRPDTLKLTPFS